MSIRIGNLVTGTMAARTYESPLRSRESSGQMAG